MTHSALRDFLVYRGITDPCPRCHGLGRYTYANTATWRRGGMAGQMCTEDVCDACWGTGDTHEHGTDLRAWDAEMRRLRAETSARWLAEQCGATLDTLRPAVLAVADIVEAAGRKRKLPDGVRPLDWDAVTRALPATLREMVKP